MATAISGELPPPMDIGKAHVGLPRAPAPAAQLSPRAPLQRRGTIALANSTVNALVQQVRGGDDRARHEAYGSLWRLVRSSKKLQLSVFDTLQRQRMLEAIFNDVSNTFRGLRQSAAKLIMSLVHRSSYIQTMMLKSPALARFVMTTDTYCAEVDDSRQIVEGVADERNSGCCICLLACGREFTRQASRLKALQRQGVPGDNDDDDMVLGSAIITAMLADARFIPGDRRDYVNEKENETFLPEASASDALTIPSLDWQNGPVDPDRFLLGFVKKNSQSTRDGVGGKGVGDTQSSTHQIATHPKVVTQHMHRWKDHVSRSLLTQLSVLHDIYRTSIIVERRQHSKDLEFESTVVVGSVSKAVFGLVFRHACIESAHSSGQGEGGNRSRQNDSSDSIIHFVKSEDPAVGQNSAAATRANGSDSTTTVTPKPYNSSLVHIHRIISSEVGVRKMPHGLRGVMLFEDFLVSSHDTVFTECPDRIRSWNVFRRYWVHRWAADRLRSQLGHETCKCLLDGFDETVRRHRYIHEAVEGGEGKVKEFTVVDGEIKVRCSEFYRHLEGDSFLARHRLRNLILRAVSLGVDEQGKEEDYEDAISWGMYMHALVFHIHESHTEERRSRTKKARDAAMNAPKPFKYSDPRDTLTTVRPSGNADRQPSETDFASSSISSSGQSGTGSDGEEDDNVLGQSPQAQPSEIERKNHFENDSKEQIHETRQKESPQVQPSQRRSGKSPSKKMTPFNVSPTLMGERVQSKRHALIHRLAHKQRRLRNLELELQRADDKAVENIKRQKLMSPARKKKLKERDAHENAKRERLRVRVKHLRHNVTRLNEKVGLVTGGEHKLVTAATGISLVQEASRISRLDDAKSKHRREVHARVARNKRLLEEQIERKRRVVEAKAAKKLRRPVSGMRSTQRFGAQSNTHIVPRRPASAGARSRRSRASSKYRRVGIMRGQSTTRMKNRSKVKRIGTSSPSLKLRTTRVEGIDTRVYDSAVVTNSDDDVDARMHDFGMPGYGTSRAWQELKLFFAERVRINKANAAKEQRRRANHIRRRESEHIKRVQRRKNARSRSAHARLVARHRATEKVLAERARRAEVEATRISDAHERQHTEDVAWIKSTQFSPRARGSAYDSMRRLVYSATPTASEENGDSRHNVDRKYARPQSASPRLRNKQNATSLMQSSNALMDNAIVISAHANLVGAVGIPLDVSRISSSSMEQQRPSTAQGMYHRNMRPDTVAAAPSKQHHHYGASSASLSAREVPRAGSTRIELPNRPSTARSSSNAAIRPSMLDRRGATKHSQLVAELAGAKSLLEEIKSEQQALQGRISKTLSDSERHGNEDFNKIGNAGNPQSSDTLGTLPSSTGSTGNSGKGKASKSGGYEQSLVKTAIVEAVQMQMLRQWPSKHMSLRVRRLVHEQLRSRAETRAENVELDHATQRLTGKKSSSVPAKSSLHLQGPEDLGRSARSGSVSTGVGNVINDNGKRGSEPGKPPAPRVRPKDAPSAFEHMRSVSGASPLIKFRRIRSQNL